jgi:hypothetical protein
MLHGVHLTAAVLVLVCACDTHDCLSGVSYAARTALHLVLRLLHALCRTVLCVQVCEVRGRLLSYWSRQVLVEAAAEVYPPCSSSRGPPHVRVALPNQVRR